MTTPTRQPIGAALQDLVPSSSFLQQLLEEISGSGTPTVVRGRATSQGTPSQRASPNKGRRASSVWVGGTSIAQEAREQLRAADEARVRRDSVTVSDHATPYLNTLCFDPTSPSSSRSSPASSTHDPHLVSPVKPIASNQETSSAVLRESESRSTVGGLRLPGSAASHLQLSAAGGSYRTAASLIFCDIDSDVSSTPSPTEPPTSALSAALTDATSISDDRPRSPRALQSRSPEKRAWTPELPSGTLSKKMRTIMLPIYQGNTIQPTTRSSWRSSIGSDNRSLFRSPTFTERSPAVLDHASFTRQGTLPELSSFRPEAVDTQGVAPVSVTPVRPSTRRPSAIEQDPSPEPDDTPIFARSFHLVDTDVSIYKKVHGDEWRQNSLCLYCFRRHGSFNKLTRHGYEVCGRNEALESHYWESDGDDGYR